MHITLSLWFMTERISKLADAVVRSMQVVVDGLVVKGCGRGALSDMG